MHILFVSTNGVTEASTRYRVLQFFDALRAAGHAPELTTFFATAVDGGRLARVSAGIARRWIAWATLDRYDLVVVHRELLPFSLNHLAPLLARRCPLVYDFDDAVFLPSRNGWRSRLRAPRSTSSMVRAARHVLAGNAYLAEWARHYNPSVEVLPTVVDTTVYRPRAQVADDDIPIVGWIGSPTTACYLSPLWPILDDLARSFSFRLRVIGAGASLPHLRVPIETPAWRAETEAADFASIDIGLYPLPDDEWARGKCGFKAIQYLASGVAAVVSPVGVVRDIVRDGVDGGWATTPRQWRDAVAALLSSAAERRRLGASGRARVEAGWSLRATTPRLVAALERAVAG